MDSYVYPRKWKKEKFCRRWTPMPTPENGKRKNSTVDGRFESQIYKKRKSSPPAGFKKERKKYMKNIFSKCLASFTIILLYFFLSPNSIF